MAMSARPSKQIRTMRDLLRETEIHLLECKVCFEKFSQQRRPRNLPCGHIICQECVSSLARSPRLECPFCRRACRASETSDCLPVLHLIEILSTVVIDASASGAGGAAQGHVPGLASAGCALQLAFGGWGKLINPTGVAVCQQSGSVVVAHDGKKRVHVFGSTGARMQQFAAKGEFRSDVKYPLDVAVTMDGYIVVTDAGDRSIKVFDFNGRSKLVIKETFILPWGVDMNPQNEMIVTDSEAGTLCLLAADFKKGKLQKNLKVLTNMCHPHGVAVCRASGAIAVVEHLKAAGSYATNTRVKIFNRAMKLVGQVDSFGLSLLLPSELHATAVAFDQQTNILVADAHNRMVFCLGKVKEFPSFRPVVTHGLSYPVAMACAADNTLHVLDSGDHSVKIYSSGE
ncbi:E3 ubiquitin-protein ligase NHLRC1 [Ambystoma mexicanum]|uniref:E3 ubiquitin-protein ligase NHLRC1 n=1 Tax=Ambystoma mexicanum TaxID=8296 RepID=UPI0037E85645